MSLTARRTATAIAAALSILAIIAGLMLSGEDSTNASPDRSAAAPTPVPSFTVKPDVADDPVPSEATDLEAPTATVEPERVNPDDAAPSAVADNADSDALGASAPPEVAKANDRYNRTPRKPVSVSQMEPNRLLIPSINRYLTITTEGRVNSGGRQFLNVPTQAWRVGHDTQTAALDAKTGSTVLAGHSVLAGQDGPLVDVAKIKPGSVMWTTDGDGTRTAWRATTRKDYGKKSLDPALFSKTGERQLVLITCGGPVGTVEGPGGQTYRGYTRNVVLTATPVAVK